MYEAIYEIMRGSVIESADCYKKLDNVNIALAGMAARYVAICEVYKNNNAAKKALNEMIKAKELSYLEGHMAITPHIRQLLLSDNPDIASIKNILQIGTVYRASYKEKLLAIMFREESSASKLPRVRALNDFLNIIESSFASSSSIGEDLGRDAQLFLSLTSSLIPSSITRCEDKKESIDYEERVKSFASKVEAIVKKNDKLGGKNDYKVLYGIIRTFRNYDFILDEDFVAAVASNNSSFTRLHEFLSQEKLSALLLAINIDNPDKITEEMQIIYNIKQALANCDIEEGYEEICLTDLADVTPEISKQAKSFLKCFEKVEIKSSKELVDYVISQGGILCKALMHKVFSASRYFMLAVDISLITLSILAGVNVLIANGLLIASLSLSTVLAFVAAESYKNSYDINRLSSDISATCSDLYARFLAGRNATPSLAINYKVYDDKELRDADMFHSGVVVEVDEDDISEGSSHSCDEVTLQRSSSSIN